MVLIIEENSPPGGNLNGKPQLNSQLKELYLTIMSCKIKMESNSMNGLKKLKLLNSILKKDIKWVISLSQPEKPLLLVNLLTPSL